MKGQGHGEMVHPSVLLIASVLSQGSGPIVRTDFIYEHAPFPSAHASTVAETADGLVAAWYGGTGEGEPDVAIWLSRHDGTRWSRPVEVATGLQPDGTRYPSWNPVLVQPSRGPLILFYKVGPRPAAWWGMAQTSTNRGRTWSGPVRLPDGILGPIRAKPVILPDGTLLAGSSSEHAGWVVQMERWQPPQGDWAEGLALPSAWNTSGPLNDPSVYAAIQPTILMHSATRLQILCRSRQRVITQAWSTDGAHTWSRMTATTLPNPNAGIDAVRLADGRFLLVYNPTVQGRGQLAVDVSVDGIEWRRAVTLEDAEGEFSYPAMIQSRDGMVHLTYTWKRERIKHVVLDPVQIR